MTAILYGLASALAWGAADFTGGVVSKRTSAYGVVICAEGTGAVLFTILALASGEAIPPLQTWLWSILGGLGGGLGLVLFFQALSRGRMSVAAPVSAVVGAMLTVLVGAFIEGFPGAWTSTGILLALAAVWMIARGENRGSDKTIRFNEITLPLIAGIAFGLFFVCMHQAGQEAIIWPISAARLASSLSVLAFALVTRQSWIPAGRHWPMITLSGVLDASGNAFFMLCGQAGRLDVAVVLCSLYPGTTVLLAGWLLHERLNRLQITGILTALAAIVLMTV